MDDSESATDTQLRAEYRALKKIKIIVFGDHLAGKSAFLSAFCEISPFMKSKKTVGCDVFLLKRQISYDFLAQQKEQKFNESFLFEFWELSGDKPQRQGVPLYFRQQMSEFKGALFFFDCTNLKTLFNFHSWVKTLFDSSSNGLSYKNLWELPFILIATTNDRLSKESLKEVQAKVVYGMRSVFRCCNGENIIYLRKDFQEHYLALTLFEMFLNHLSVESELKSSEPSHNSEYLKAMEKVISVKDTAKYTLNNEYLINRIRLKSFDGNEVEKMAKSGIEKLKEKACCCRRKLRYFWNFLLRRKEKEKTMV